MKVLFNNAGTRFQFLIGSLEAFGDVKASWEELTFQFLIGSLEALCVKISILDKI